MQALDSVLPPLILCIKGAVTSAIIRDGRSLLRKLKDFTWLAREGNEFDHQVFAASAEELRRDSVQWGAVHGGIRFQAGMEEAGYPAFEAS